MTRRRKQLRKERKERMEINKMPKERK